MAGPALRAVNPWVASTPEPGARHQLLSDDERAKLAKIASIVRFKKADQIYREGEKATAAFNIISGIVSAHRAVDDSACIVSFLYSGDLFGLSEEGNYVNSAEALTPVVAYKMPLLAVRRMLENDARLDIDVIVKLCEELREAQRHALLLAQKRATTRLAMFFDLQENLQIARGEPTAEIYLPMGRSSIAAYLALTPAALSRAFQALVSTKIIAVRNRRHIKILNRQAFDMLADIRPTEDA